MAQKVAAVTGAWSAAATWNSVTNTPTLHASTNITISTSNLFTATFTAPNTTNACTGVLLFIPAVGSGGTVTVTLQESTIDTAATRSIAVTSLVAGTWVYFTFATPYIFTTIVAGSYRFKIVNAGAAGTTTAAADSGGANIAYLATDDQTGVPGTTDNVWIVGLNQATAITVTMDGTQTIGSTGTTGIGVARSLLMAVTFHNLGVLAWDTAASATLTCQGNIYCGNNLGELQMGTVGTPMPAASLATLRFSMATSGDYGITVAPTGKLTLQGTPKSSTTLWKAKLSSGVGTAASPAIISAAVDWSVGDEILIGTTDTYDHNEVRFIITKNSATSYVWSATSGGAEAALTHTHTTDAWVINLGRNVFIDSTNSVRAFYVLVQSSIDGYVNVDWARFDVIGSGLSQRTAFTIDVSSGTTGYGSIDYSVFTRGNVGLQLTSTRVPLSFTGLVGYNEAGSALNIGNALSNKTFTDCFAFSSGFSGIGLQNSAFSITATRCYAIGCNTGNNSGQAGFLMVGGSMVLGDCEAHACRQSGIRLAGVADGVFNTALVGTKGSNTIDVQVGITAAYNTTTFNLSSFGSATLISGYTTMLPGSEVRFQGYNGNLNNHTWYTAFGAARSTGAGLVDTTVKTAGSLGIRLAPEDLISGFRWEFLIGINANSAASIFGFAQKNVAMGSSVVTIELFLPGSIVADATATLDNTTGSWQVFNLAASYTGLVASFATIRVTAKTATAAAYVYFDDFYNGTNVLTALDAWYNGKPTPVMTDLLGDPAAVWTQLTSTFTTAGTVGKLVADNLDASIADVEADTQDIQARVPAALTAGGNIKADTLMIEGVDATNQIRDSILTDATRFAGADIAATLARLPATLDGGNIRAIVKAMDAGVITSGVIATNAIDADALAADAVTEIQSGLSTLTAAQVVTAILAELIKGKTIQEVLLDIWAQTVGDATANNATAPTLITYKSPDNSTEVTHTLTPTTRVQS